MKLTSILSKKEYLLQIKQSFDSRFDFGEERIVGWVIFNIFSISYYSGKEFGRRNYPISNKIIGFVKNKKGKAEIRYMSFKGMTDPISILILYFGTVFILFNMHASSPFLYSLLWTLAIMIPTYLITLVSEVGQEGEDQLIKFIDLYGRL